MNNALLIFGGIANLLLAVFHVAFWKIFDWPASLAALSLDNRSIMQVTCIHLILVTAIFAYVSLFHRQELVSSKLGRFMLGGIAFFYFARVVNEFIFWGIIRIDSIVIVLLCVIIGAAYAVPLFASMSKRVQTS